MTFMVTAQNRATDLIFKNENGSILYLLGIVFGILSGTEKYKSTNIPLSPIKLLTTGLNGHQKCENPHIWDKTLPAALNTTITFQTRSATGGYGFYNYETSGTKFNYYRGIINPVTMQKYLF
jgi:hypothetical protein